MLELRNRCPSGDQFSAITGPISGPNIFLTAPSSVFQSRMALSLDMPRMPPRLPEPVKISPLGGLKGPTGQKLTA